uniref:Chromosome 11 open reading frame 97 n=2 Tax=Chrysemys picta bellii TaxID=8478 RepID=A0A8C3PDD1_CHRPI|nr:uncharacterized protein C11orf97 homolog [Chrysemys picta bellii]
MSRRSRQRARGERRPPARAGPGTFASPSAPPVTRAAPCGLLGPSPRASAQGPNSARAAPPGPAALLSPGLPLLPPPPLSSYGNRPARPAAGLGAAGRGGGMREAAGEQQQQEPAPGEAGNSVCAEPAGSGHCSQPWKKFVYVEPPKRVKEVLEEELYFRRDGCQIKHPAAVALEGIWSVKRNFSVGGLKPASQNRNSLLSQPKYYSRHGGIRR